MPELKPKPEIYLLVVGDRRCILPRSLALILHKANMIRPAIKRGNQHRYKVNAGFVPHFSDDGRIAFKREQAEAVFNAWLNLNCRQLEQQAPATADPLSLIDPRFAAALTLSDF